MAQRVRVLVVHVAGPELILRPYGKCWMWFHTPVTPALKGKAETRQRELRLTSVAQTKRVAGSVRNPDSRE